MKTLPLLTVAILTFGTGLTQSPEAMHQRNLLTGRMDEKRLAAALVSRAQWKPFPGIEQRRAWETVPENLKKNVLRDAESAAQEKWEPLPASLFLEYARTGNRSRFESQHFARRQKLATLVLAEIFENRGRYLDYIADGLWAICEESFWGIPAHLGAQKRGTGLADVSEPTVDLFVAETGSLLAWTAYLLGDRLDRVSPLIRERIEIEAERRILAPNLQRDDFWWMGFGARRSLNNWTPWICSNWLSTALILERDEGRRRSAVHKIMRVLDNFLNIYPDDGGCDEGPGYWGRAGGSLFECLEQLHSATGDAIDWYSDPLVRNIGEYIAKAYIKDDYFINFADANAKVRPDAALIYLYGKRAGSPLLTGFGTHLARRANGQTGSVVPNTGSLLRVVPSILYAEEMLRSEPAEPLLGEFWLPDIQVMGARSHPGSAKGFYLAAKGGHNDESHNHNDVGNFIVYADGKPVLIDVGVETYTSKTFSSRRYEIWTMQSAYHNLPTVNGAQQKNGREYRARSVEFRTQPESATFTLDIAGAYPPEARLKSWKRSLVLTRGRGVELADEYSLSECREPVRLNLMTPMVVNTTEAGRVVLSPSEGSAGAAFLIQYDPARLSAAAEEIPLQDARLRSAWGNRLTRIVLTSKSQALDDSYRIHIWSK